MGFWLPNYIPQIFLVIPVPSKMGGGVVEGKLEWKETVVLTN